MMPRSLALLALLVAALLGCGSEHAVAQLGDGCLTGRLQLPARPKAARPAPLPASQRITAGRTTVRGHVLTIPRDLPSRNGAYDLVIHFHGNPDAVEESFVRAGVDAVVVIVNLGELATRYIDRFSDPGQLEGILRRVDEKLAAQGLEQPRRRRLALSSWSAGYGAILRILDHPRSAPLVDAVLLLDGIHARRMPVTGGIDRQDLHPFLAFASRAAANRALLVITHSDIEPEGPLVSAGDCAEHLLAELAVPRRPARGRVAPTELEAAHAAYSAKRLWPLELATVAQRRGLVVRAYEGRAPEHHIAHLFQMERLVLDDLRRWWAAAPVSGPGV